MTNSLGVALLGAGNSGGHYHLPHLLTHPGYRLRAVATRSGEVGSQLPPDVRVVAGWEQAVTGEEIDVVVVALPHDLHHPAALGALRAGKHVLVEKPLTRTAAEAQDLVETAKQAGLVLAVHHQRRFEADFAALREIVASGELGEIWRAVVARSHQGRYRESTPTAPHVGATPLDWAHRTDRGGGIARVIGPHPVDQLLTLVGRPVLAVTGRAHLDPADGVEDWVGIDVEFDGGVTGTAEAFRRSRAAPPRFIVYGSAGTAIAQDGTQIRIVTDEGERLVSGLVAPGTLGQEIYDDLHSAITRGTPLRASLDDAVRVVEVLDKAELSFRSRQGAGPTESSVSGWSVAGTR